MKAAKISVVVPVYNVEDYLHKCMETLQGQTLQDIEIILVDDGSNDASPGMCDQYARHDARVRVIHKANAGLGMARNSGLEAAKGKYVLFVDSDDWLEPDACRVLYERAEEEKADACTFGYRRVVAGKTTMERTSGLQEVYRGNQAIRSFYLEVLGSSPSAPDDFRVVWQSACFTLYSMSVIRLHRLHFESEREQISEDYLFNMEYFRHVSCVCVVRQVFYNYRESPGSLTQTYRQDRFLKVTAQYQEELRRLSAMGVSPDYVSQATLRLQRCYLGHARDCISKICRSFSSFATAKEPILAVCRQKTLRQVLLEYPWRKNPFKHRVFNYGLSKEHPFLLYALCRLKR